MNNNLLTKQKRITMDIARTKDEIDYLEREKYHLEAERDSNTAFLLIIAILSIMVTGFCAKTIIAQMITLVAISTPIVITTVFPKITLKFFQKISDFIFPKTIKLLKDKEKNIENLKVKLISLEKELQKTINELNKENQIKESTEPNDYAFKPNIENNRKLPYINMINRKVRRMK